MGCCASSDQTYQTSTMKHGSKLFSLGKGVQLIQNCEQLIKNKEFSQVIKMCRKMIQ